MPRKYFSDEVIGDDLATKANTWASVTITRPVARTAMNGRQPFVVKKIGWKCCSAPSISQKIYARISNADGSVYDDSYIANTISWQKQAVVMYEFQAINLHFDDDAGGKIRAWLIAGGPFLFARNTKSGGSTQTATGQVGGTAVGYVTYAQVALPPEGFKVQRDPQDANKVTLVYTGWDVKKDPDACGDSTSLMGYVVQVARDPEFTEKVRLVYVSKGAGEINGLYKGWDWYFRIATRNEVSEKYKLPGGVWGKALKIDADLTPPPLPDPTTGLPGGATDAGSNTDTDDSGGLSGNNPNAGSNSGGGSTTTTTTTTYVVTEQVTNTAVKAGKDILAAATPHINDGASAAVAQPSVAVWTTLLNQLSSLGVTAQTVADALPTGSTKNKWVNFVTRVGTTKASVQLAIADAGGAQSTAMQLEAALETASDAQKTLYNAILIAKDRNTAETWRDVAQALDSLAIADARMASLLTGGVQTLWSNARAGAAAAATVVRAAVVELTAAKIDAARSRALDARNLMLLARNGTTAPVTSYSTASKAVVKLAADLDKLIAATSEVDKVTRVVTVPPGTTIPSNSNGAGGSGVAGGSTPTPTQNSDGTTTIVYTPIPDTTALRTRAGGLLISRSSRVAPGHTVYLMDRGGRQRLGQFKAPTVLEYNRIRDDQSLAFVTLSGDSLKANRAVLEALSVGRHELCIFRGEERVWEGPATLATFKANEVIIRAHDITHYLNRTVIKNAYSNAYPNLDLVVNRIAGIIANELAVKEAIDPPVNVMPYVRTYVQDGDARTSRTTLAAEATVWQHLDDLAAKAGLDYTVIGRALHIWDTSRAALGRIRRVTEADFLGEPYISAYGMELATQTFVSDGQGNYGRSGGVDDYYGEIDLLATAYDENGNAVNQDDTDSTNDTVPIAEMDDQAARNLKGRNPLPLSLKVPDGSSLRTDRGIGLDVLIPGVLIPVTATLSGRTINQTMKLKEVKVRQDNVGETVSISVTPASESDDAESLVE